MKQERQYPKVMITPKAKQSIQNGHPWIYGEEIIKVEGEPQNGSLVDVFAGNSFMGTGFIIMQAKLLFGLFHAMPMIYLMTAFGDAA